MSHIISAYLAYAVLSIFLILVVKLVRRRLSQPHYPPGPKGLPLIGNVFDVPPMDGQGLAYANWSRQYGSDVIHLNLAGTHLIILNSAEAASDLLEKRSAIYSDRPNFPMLVDLMSWDIFIFYQYGDKWRASRRLFNKFYNVKSVAAFDPKMRKATHELLYRLVHDPADFSQNIRLWAASVILNVTYGIDVHTSDNPYLLTIEAATSVSHVAANPGAFIVDVIPILKYVPEWVPGAGFKRKAREWRELVVATAQAPFDYAKKQMDAGLQIPSMISMALQQLGSYNTPEAQAIVRATAATAFVGAADTTTAAFLTFFLAMNLYPEAQKKAQEEIDRVVGQERLPELSDLPSLPYVNAVIKEILRWSPPLPLGFPHQSTQDDVYNGNFIPAGSVVLSNIWAICRDEQMFEDPTKFNPDRFLKDGKLDQSVPLAFGFGRRICPGKCFAESSVLLAAANILSVFDIGNAIDDDGNIIVLSEKFIPGAVCFPEPFKCSIKPRSNRATELITEAYSAYHYD